MRDKYREIYSTAWPAATSFHTAHAHSHGQRSPLGPDASLVRALRSTLAELERWRSRRGHGPRQRCTSPHCPHRALQLLHPLRLVVHRRVAQRQWLVVCLGHSQGVWMLPRTSRAHHCTGAPSTSASALPRRGQGESSSSSLHRAPVGKWLMLERLSRQECPSHHQLGAPSQPQEKRTRLCQEDHACSRAP